MIQNAQPETESGIRFLAVIVLYKMAAKDSVSFRTLQQAASRLGDGNTARILIVDNTPGATNHCKCAHNVLYHAAGENLGLPNAFNYALDLAHREGCDWLITLDQDTALPPEFLVRIAEIANRLKCDPSIAAIVPQINGDGRILSPNWFRAGAFPRWFPSGYTGVPDKPTFAFNSAAALRVRTLRAIGGYDPLFWLDHCDSALYYKLHCHGRRVFVAGNIQVQHHFSMLDKEKRMTLVRYRNILVAESAFWDLAMNRLAGMERTARLLGRWCKQVLHGHNAGFRKETAQALKRRLFSSRASRIAQWKREMNALKPALANGSDRFPGLKESKRAPQISVIIVNWNGKQFLDTCLSSLRSQTFSDCETILVDNGSEDGSVDFVRQQFPEVRVISLNRNVGFAAANNVGFDYAEGPLIVLLNNDTKVHPDCLQQIYQGSRDFPKAASFACKMLYFDEPQRIENCGFDVSLSGATVDLGRGDLDGTQWAQSRQVFGACGGAAAYRRTMLQEIGLFDPDFFLIYEDVDLAFRAQLNGFTCMYLPEAVVYHRYRASIGVSSPLQVFFSQRNTELVYLKNMPLPMLLKSLPQRIMYEVGAAIYFTKSGSGRAFLRAKAHALRLLPTTWRKRQQIQRSRTASTADLVSLMKRTSLAAKLEKFLLLWRSHATVRDAGKMPIQG